MPRKPFLPKTDDKSRIWLNNFVDKLMDTKKPYAVKYNVSASDITELDQGRQWANWALDNITGSRVANTTLTAFKDDVLTGTLTPSAPVAPVYPTAPAVPLMAGVLTMAAAIGTQIKHAPNYDPTDGEDMGLEGAEITPPNPATTQPDLSRSHLGSGGYVEIVWPKAGFDAIKLVVDRGSGEAFLAVDTVPDYIDTVKPAPGATATYTYRGIYMLNDAEFGQWSLPMALTLRG